MEKGVKGERDRQVGRERKKERERERHTHKHREI